MATSNVIEAMAPASTMPRPRQSDPLVMKAASIELAKECASQFGGDVDQWAEDLASAHDWSDGYQLAKRLDERFYYDVTAEMVDVLSGAASYRWNAHTAAVKQWVQIAGFTPQFSIGDRVQWRGKTGTINKIEAETARYVIDDGDPKFARGGGYVVDAEDVRAADAPAL